MTTVTAALPVRMPRAGDEGRNATFTRLVRAFAEALTDDDLDRLADVYPEVVAHAIVDALPDVDTGALEEALGPFYDTAGLRRRLKITRQALASRVAAGSLLAIPDETGRLLYPTFQFRAGTAEVLPGVGEIVRAVTEAGADHLTCAMWLTALDPRLGQPPIEGLRHGGGDTVLRNLRADLDRWFHQ
ncbi:MAG TPA: hypothetical protein PLX71_04760 [Phycicoccus sp.]|nr:hypothetical protein [Phycicoccus sp.]